MVALGSGRGESHHHAARDRRDDAWCARLRADVAADLLDLGLPGLAMNVRDAVVRDSLMTLTTMDPPVVALRQRVDPAVLRRPGAGRAGAAGAGVRRRRRLSGDRIRSAAAAADRAGAAHRPGFANVALLRRPDDLDEETWLPRWHVDHTPVAIETQSTFGYTQNAVVRALTPGAPVISRDRRGAVSRRGDRRSARVLRRGRRRRSARPDGADGRQHRRHSAPTRTSTPCPPVATSSAVPFDAGRPKVSR